MQRSALSPLPALLTDTEKIKKPRCYFAGKETIHLNNPKCAAGAVLFIIDKVGCLIHSHCRVESPQMWSLVTSGTPPHLAARPKAGHWDKQRDRGQECVLMTVKQKGAVISRFENKFTGRGRGEKSPLQLNYWNRYNTNAHRKTELHTPTHTHNGYAGNWTW